MSDKEDKGKKNEKPGRSGWFKTINAPQKMSAEELSKALEKARKQLEDLKLEYRKAKSGSPKKEQLALEIERVAGAIDGLKNGLSSAGEEYGVQDRDTETPEKAEERIIKKENECFVATMVYGPDAVETQILRRFRDQRLRQSQVGRGFIRCYYRLGPTLAALLEKWPCGRRVMQRLLDNIVALLRINYSEK